MLTLPIVLPEGHEDDEVIVSVSGGKDSFGAVLAARESGIRARYVFADTGWEAQQTYDHIANVERLLGITVDRVGFPGGMVAKILARTGFPSRLRRWCTRELKVQLIRAYHDTVADAAGVDTLSVVGIRAEESEARALMPRFEYDENWGGYVFRPMLDATVEEVIALHHRHGVPLNPLYHLGFDRVGCNPCIYESKEGIELTAQHFPARIDLIRWLEQECERLRAERNVEEPGRYGHAEATFFQAKMVDHYTTERRWVPTPPKGRARGKRSAVQGAAPEGSQDKPGCWRDVKVPVWKPMHIDDVVSWSRTSKGGRQLKVIREEPSGGCFRWGMCDPPTPGASHG